MRIVGRSQGIVHRQCRHQPSRWMYQPKHERKKIDWEEVGLWLMAWGVMFVIVFVAGITWLYS